MVSIIFNCILSVRLCSWISVYSNYFESHINQTCGPSYSFAYLKTETEQWRSYVLFPSTLWGWALICGKELGWLWCWKLLLFSKTLIIDKEAFCERSSEQGPPGEVFLQLWQPLIKAVYSRMALFSVRWEGRISEIIEANFYFPLSEWMGHIIKSNHSHIC